MTYGEKPTVAEVDAEIRTWSDSALELHADRLSPDNHAKHWNSLSEAQKYARRCSNELTGRRYEQALADKRAAEAHQRQAEREKQAEAAKLEYLNTIRAHFQGSVSDWDTVKDELWRRHLIEEMETRLAAERQAAALRYDSTVAASNRAPLRVIEED